MLRRSVFIVFIVLAVSIFLIFDGCKKLPYIPDENAVIYLESVPAVIKPGETAKIMISGEKGNGYPLPDGTVVFLTASVGTLDREAVLSKGKAEAVYRADNGYTGEVVITARCGQAAVSPEQLTISVTQTEVAFLYISADPALLPQGGGTSTITARAVDESMEPVTGKRLWFETTAGTLQVQGDGLTGSDGQVDAVLTTNLPATVTVKYGDLEQSVEIVLQDANTPPNAEFVFSPTAPRSGDRVRFNARASRDEDGEVVSYEWDFGDGKTAGGVEVNHTYKTEEKTVFVATLKVTDNQGAVGVASREITVNVTREEENEPPTAAFEYSPKSPVSGERVYFNAEASSDSDGDVVLFQWDFGDGAAAQGKMVSHIYSFDRETTVTVTLKVTDNLGGEGVTSTDIVISAGAENSKPSADFTYSPLSPKLDDIVYFNGESSTDDGDIVAYEWDFGDGDTAQGVKVNHRYGFTNTTTVVVSLKVTDDQGAQDIESKEITVSKESNINPVAAFTFSPQSPVSEETVYFNAEASTDSDGDIVSFEWDFGDGSTAKGEAVTHAFSVTQTTKFIVTLKVTDDKGGEGVISKEITVTP
jgi:PKD repeat protein